MKVAKKKIAELDKCYALAKLMFRGEPCFLVASEKEDACIVFSEDGRPLDTVWTSPGGVMSMEQLPAQDGRFLATQRFYSPDHAKDAEVVIASPKPEGGWDVRTLCRAPFVHRIGILERGGRHWLIVCCLKSGCEYDGDWRFPGACYGAELPDDLSGFGPGNELPLKLIRGGMLRNHGFSKAAHDGHDAGLIGCEEGTFLFDPPAGPDGEWEVTQLCAVPSSDSVLADFDGDGRPELGCISPFHGNSLTIYHLDEFGNYFPQWTYGRPARETEMIHATWCCSMAGRTVWIAGWRGGTRNTIAVSWDAVAGDYRAEVIDASAGCANAMHFVNAAGEDVIVAANREIDEAALYTVTG